MKKAIAETFNTMGWLAVAYGLKWLVADNLLQVIISILMMAIAITCVHQIAVLLVGEGTHQAMIIIGVMTLEMAAIWGVIWGAKYLQIIILNIELIWQGLMLTVLIRFVGIISIVIMNLTKVNVHVESPRRRR